MARRSLTVLGATGSIGKSTLDLVQRNPEAFEIVALTAQSNVAALAEAARATRARLAVIGDPAPASKSCGRRSPAPASRRPPAPRRSSPPRRSPPIASWRPSSAPPGSSRPSKRHDKGGGSPWPTRSASSPPATCSWPPCADAGTELLPVDSEHSACLQALAGAAPESIERIVLTASGGPFRTWSLEQLREATPEQALRHPNWSMGAKITINSATLMNKGLELIEAYHLFPVSAGQLGVVIHPQSIVHCLVSYTDGSVLAQMACPDMRTPIALALSWPQRMTTPTPRLDLAAIGSLSFEAPDEVRFPALTIARDALALGGTAPAILSAANEVAVEAFLARRIGFLDIARNAADTLEAAQGRGLIAPASTLGDILAAVAEARRLAQSMLGRYV